MNILLHMCCGPCACYPVPKLRSEGHDITGYFSILIFTLIKNLSTV